MKKVTLFLMTGKGYALLEEILKVFGAGVIDQVITAADKKILKDYYDEIKALCQAHGIPVMDRRQEYIIRTEFSLVVSWQWLIGLPEGKRLIVFHDSLLPKYRGFAPLVNALINQEPLIGVTALFARQEYDRGDIISQAFTPVSYPIRIEEAIKLVNKNYSMLALEVIRKIAENQPLTSTPQQEEEASYSLWRDEQDYRIDWSSSSEDILRFIHAVSFPYKGASTLLEGKLIRVQDAALVPDVRIENRAPGKLIFMEEGLPVVVCGKGLLKLKKLQDDSSQEDLLPLKKFRIRFA